MIRRSLRTGLIAGILISLAGLYPAVSLYLPAAVPEWGTRVVESEILHGILLMLSAGIGLPTLLLMGVTAVHQAQARGLLPSIKVGVLTGVTAGIFVYVILIAPLNALVAYSQIAFFEPTFETILPPEANFLRFLEVFEVSLYLLQLIVLSGALIGGLQGAFMGWRHRHQPLPAHSNLYGFIARQQHPRNWFISSETAAQTGLIVGTLIGGLVFLAFIQDPFINFVRPELAALLRSDEMGLITGPMTESGSFLWPLILLGFMGLGAFIVIFSKNPSCRFRTRIQGTILATYVVLMCFFIIGLRIFFLHIVLGPFAILKLMRDAPAEVAQISTEAWEFIHALFFGEDPTLLIATFLLTPWLFLLVYLLTGWIIGGMQGAFYTLVVPIFYKQPVDKAITLKRQLIHNPNDLLPLMYGLFYNATDAYPILAHFAAYTYDAAPMRARLAAAYHSLGTSETAEEIVETVTAIQEILSDRTEWRWAADYRAVYRALDHMLRARTLEQVLQIEPPTQQTMSLPPIIIKSLKRVAHVMNELHKVEKVDDLSTKLIFLENSLAAIHEAEQVAKKRFGHTTQQTIFPAQVALTAVLEHLQEIVLAAIKGLKGRADVTAVLQNQSCSYCTPLPLVFQVANQGLNVAQQVRLNILPGQEYRVTEGQSLIEILSPGEERQMTLSVMPHYGTERLRVEWEIMYDDAVDDNRNLTFADVVEFAALERPFQRIFPIPYVTGTPLKTDDVFVGRQDVFAFIRENLLGVHQNNVIILHGQRRTGKTSVLYRLGQVMNDTHYGVLIDMQGKPARGEVDFLYSIADDIVFALEDHGIEVDLPPRSEFEESPEFFFHSRFLRGLQPHLNGKNLLLMFDEFEELQRRVEDGRLEPDIFQFLRYLMQHEKHVDFVFSGTHKLEDLGAKYWSVLFNIAAYKPITFLSYNDVRHLILEPVKNHNVEYDELAIERIMEVTAGHPYFTQLILHEMIVYHNETQRNYLTVTDVNHALDQIVQRGEAHFKYIWAESSAAERLILQAMTELLIGRESVTVHDLNAFLAERGHESQDEWAAALSGLESRDIVTRKSVRNPLYRFKVDLIRIWIERTKPAL